MAQSRARSGAALLVFLMLSCTRPVGVLDANLAPGAGGDDRTDEEVIYGDDNRLEFFEESDPVLKQLSDSTVALMGPLQIGAEVNGTRELLGFNYAQTYGLCKDEKYAEQNVGAFCSGFLIAPDLVATASHCIPDLKTCMETSFAFGYAVTAPGSLPKSLPSHEVYSCVEVLRSQRTQNGPDFAVIRLDHPVTNHSPLKLNTAGAIAPLTELSVIGYPVGLPLKIASGAQVRNATTPGYFVANLDTYGGNSGSAVINSKTHEVEGILVRGEKDFVWNGKDECARSYRCKEDECRGEDVTRIDEIVKSLNFGKVHNVRPHLKRPHVKNKDQSTSK